MARTVLDRADAVRALAGVFRKRGFDGASLSVVQQETGIGRGSLYHFFPDGKEDMARAVLEEVRAWFDEQVFAPLRTPEDPAAAVGATMRAVEEYFLSRHCVCLYAVMTLGQDRPAHAEAVRSYFADWVELLARTVEQAGVAGDEARARAVDAVAAVQGALVLARALDDDTVVTGVVDRSRRRLLDGLG
ncbi:TetR/AcrR family transcriptional regulator [Kineococcus sp. NPDC059986]|jgi:AcrR family transcriptional regulator|uniref:TetR/AcrR family transcriptional regulator n=1 Tax=Kineococcus sp. NPDC059986 TaxID=3155538 RepID=UPI00344D3857